MKKKMNGWNTGAAMISKCLFASVVLVFTNSCEEPKPNVTEAIEYTPEPMPTDQDYGLYGVESGVVIRLFKSDSTRQEIYFDHWGARQAKYEYIHMQGEDTSSLWTAIINNRSTSYYLSRGNTYFSLPNNRINKTIKWDSLGFENERALVDDGYTCIGTQEVEGKLCKVWEYVLGETDTMRSYIYKGVLLKETEYERGRHKAKEISISLKENIEIPEEKFTVPDNYTVKETSTSTSAFDRIFGH